ncbi:MAG: hypothetical protein NUW22_06300 [Acidobacteria bacterium]|nr:hypothetical protein [Acidobacteriota bacterium]
MNARSIRSLGVVVLACSGAWTVATQAVDVAGRNILVTVLDKAGAPIRDLTAAEFAVVEDGVRREVTSAALATEPLFVSVLIDNAKAPLGAGEPTRDMRTSLSTFIKTLQAARPDTQVALTTVGGAGVLIKNFTDKTEDLDKVVRRLVADQRSTSVMLEALIDAARGFKKAPSPRRAIVTIDLGSKESSQIVPTKVVAEVQKAGAAVWSVSIQGSQSVTSPARDTTLDYLTQGTGGVRTTALLPSALERILKNLADVLTSQYVVTYERPDGPPAKSIVPAAQRGAQFLLAPWGQQ